MAIAWVGISRPLSIDRGNQMTDTAIEQELREMKAMLSSLADSYMTAKDVAEKLKISQPTLWRWIKNGSFPAGKNGRWLRSQVNEWGRGK